MSTNEIIEFLKENETDFLKINSFSKLPGIYAIFYIGENNFPLLGDLVNKHEIIYIGKTESSQEKRDAKTHFTSGKTGSSTVRKSIGSILCQEYNLKPIPRNTTDYNKGRFSHFKFDESSEDKITKWMINNLALSFYEYPKSKIEIETLESSIINALIPILNISKNSKNPFKSTLQKLRKNCADMAFKGISSKNPVQNKMPKKEKLKQKSIMSNFNTKSIYIDNITANDANKNQIRIKKDNKYLFPEEKSGLPISRNLNIKFKNHEFEAKYNIGSKDGKSRSGILKIDANTYKNIIKIQEGTSLKISKVDDKNYLLERI